MYVYIQIHIKGRGIKKWSTTTADWVLVFPLMCCGCALYIIMHSEGQGINSRIAKGPVPLGL